MPEIRAGCGRHLQPVSGVAGVPVRENELSYSREIVVAEHLRVVFVPATGQDDAPLGLDEDLSPVALRLDTHHLTCFGNLNEALGRRLEHYFDAPLLDDLGK